MKRAILQTYQRLAHTAETYPGIWLSCAVVGTAFLLLPFPQLVKLAVGFAAGLGFVLLIRRKAALRLPALLLLGVSLIGFTFGFSDTLRYQPVRHYSGRNIDTGAWVLDYGTRYDDRVRVQLLVTELNGIRTYPFRTYVYLPGHVEPEAGMTLEGVLEYDVPRDTDDFDRESYYRAHRVYLLSKIHKGFTLSPASLPFSYVGVRFLFPARCARWFHQRLLMLYEPEDAGILLSLILGDKSALPPGYEDDMRDVGLSHVMAVSGMNVSLVAGIVMLLFFRRRIGAAFAIPAVLLFTFITGAGASVVRAAIMQIILLTGVLIFEKGHSLNSLFVTAAIMLLLNPYAAQDAGLWLSFFSTMGLILYASRLTGTMMKPFTPLPGWSRKLIRIPVTMAATTLTAQIFVLPLLVFLFGSFSLIAPLANLLVLWATELSFSLGLGTALLSPILPHPAVLAARPVALLVAFQRRIVPVMANWPISTLHASNPYVLIGLILFYAFLLLLFLRRSRRYLVSAFSLCAVTLCLLALLGAADADRRITLTSLNLQGGQCTVLLQGDACVVVNCGGMNSAEKLQRYLESRQVRDIDLLILTDYKSSTQRGAPELSGSIPIHTVLLPRSKDPEPYDIEARQILTVDSPTEVTVKDARLQLLHADSTGFDADRLAVYITIGPYSCLIPGSISAEKLSGMLDSRAISAVNFAVAGDYYTSHTPPFRADWYLTTSYRGISMGTVRALQESGMTVVDQAVSGDVEFTLKRNPEK